MNRVARCICMFVALSGATTVHAQILRLPAAACAETGATADGFEPAPDSWSSHGSGGDAGSRNAFVSVPGFEADTRYNNREYFYYVPDRPLSQPMPVVVLLHGTAGNPTKARNEARTVRDLWTDAASRFGFAVVAPVAGSSLGSWLAPDQAGSRPTDYDVIAAALDQIEARFNIERLRRYVWGFSAGGHVSLDMMLNPWHDVFSRRRFAAVAINAGALSGLACAGVASDACDQLLRDAFPRLPLQVISGSTDPMTTRVLQDAPRFRAGGWIDGSNYTQASFGGGHWVDPAHPQQQWLWLCQFARRPDPDQRFRLRPTVP